MTINVKATKANSEADATEQYTLKSMDKKSNLPVLVGGFATCIVVYVKSLFLEAGARPEQPAEPAKPEDVGQDRSAKLQLVSVSNDLDGSRGSQSGESERGQERSTFAVRSGSGPLDLVDETPFRFFHANLRSNWDAFAVSPVIPTPSNDNNGGGSPSVHSAPGGSADGGSSGAKPPTDSDDLPDDDDEDPDLDAEVDNRAPRVTGPVYLKDVVGCATLVIGLTDLLRNADDPDDDVLTASEFSVSSGTLTQSGAEWIYSGGPLGPVTITYKISDGQYSVQQTAHLSVLPQSPIYGDDADNILLGSLCSDEIAGMDGDDNIDARAGHDVVDGGAGQDHIVGGAGNDIIYGRDGNDLIFGGIGSDHIFGGAGDDRIFGEAGDDIVFGDDGDDVLAGGDGQDILDGGDGDDQLEGGEDNDKLAGSAGNDQLDGGDGHDVIQDGAGSDVVQGGSGDDTLIAAADQAADDYHGGSGDDTLSYAEATQGVTVDLNAGSATSMEIGDDSISGFENVVGGQGDDVFVAGIDAVTFTGNGGNNEFVFGSSDAPEHPIVLYEIVDFKPGDLIKMSKYDIFEKVMDHAGDELEQIYGEKIDEAGAAIRYRRDLDNADRMVLEADLNNDQEYEVTIALHGNHALLIVENT
jgi:Ca2+-binding RTX toxin-like protein